ncbi:MAG: tryptophan--tRNA ligase [Thaumarchaeota archaeon]|nr:tryptophan--tRNA ligase [Candidatus Geocrenenecus arthurdayi]MCL7391582.1 tryptophan--tRNA ligase [Candidatus Geocrenenecus arthurdayi]MCL7395853.1 tryptophan--tRNA ligase [Candidatus Geocrenenecus arthurdayi]MCL7402390.1 tryptophan--tRNA ligase [Candidatus Geocrenenecus arthurdayi]MCL7402878.1 tryptophan--tRNA ligase [Candidatus Geocrenenecus arthurdayi]
MFGSSNREDFIVTPWIVEGEVDYNKLVEKFGTNVIDDKLMDRFIRAAGEDHYLLRRRIFFSHRDLDKVLDDWEDDRGFFLYTGRGPSGPMHIGHIIPFYFTKWLQDRFKVNVYIQLTDDEKYLEESRGLTLEDTGKWSYENALDIIAVGFDPDRTFIFQDTEYVKNMYPIALKVARKINFSWVRAVFGFTHETNIGLIFYPALQIVPSLFEKKRCLIPAAIDQDPYWRIQRDIAESLGYYKTAAIHSKFLPPLTGPAGKMSASKPESAIYLHDDPKTVRRKIWLAYSGGQPTVELHRKLGGNPEVDVAFQWLYFFFEPDDTKVKKLEEDYRSGRILSGEMKNILIEKVTSFLEEHQQRRIEAKELLHLFKYDGELAREMWRKIHV